MIMLIAPIDRRLPFPHFVLAMSFWAVHVFALQCAAAPEHPSVKQIIDAWRARQERIGSAKVVWVQDRVDKKGSINVRFSGKLQAPFPAEDTEYSNTETLQLADDKWRLDKDGQHWDLDVGTLTKVKSSFVLADGKNKWYNASGSGKLYGYISTEKKVPHLRTSLMWPIVWFLRPFEDEN